MRDFYFKGHIPSSKSLFNRALIVQSLFHNLEILGSAQSEDVEDLQRALKDLADGSREFVVRAGGTTFRFLLARLSLIPGEFQIRAHRRLLDRPHDDLYATLSQLGTRVERATPESLRLVSQGWPDQKIELRLSGKVSSQFASALLLASLAHKKGTQLEVKDLSSFEYYQMTQDLLLNIGFDLKTSTTTVEVSKSASKQEATQASKRVITQVTYCEPKWNQPYRVEPDMSSAGTIAAFAALCGQCTFLGWPQNSLQPDFAFVSYLRALGAQVEISDGSLLVTKSEALLNQTFDFQDTPDLAPVFAILMSSIPGKSQISGLGSLQHKESDRLEKICELLEKMGVHYSVSGETLQLEGQLNKSKASQVFDPDQDHRMAMAAQLANWSGCHFKILHPEVVDKSFKDFWKVTHLIAEDQKK